LSSETVVNAAADEGMYKRLCCVRR